MDEDEMAESVASEVADLANRVPSFKPMTFPLLRRRPIARTPGFMIVSFWCDGNGTPWHVVIEDEYGTIDAPVSNEFMVDCLIAARPISRGLDAS